MTILGWIRSVWGETHFRAVKKAFCRRRPWIWAWRRSKQSPNRVRANRCEGPGGQGRAEGGMLAVT